MKYALQIYGVFRTFDICLPHILNYIMYHNLDYDVFILSQRDDGYSPSNEQLIRDLLGAHHVVFNYIEDYPEHDHQYEDGLCKYYQSCVKKAQKKIQHDLVSNGFVTRLWYRRWLNNQMRIAYEQEHKITYDWVVRTRFDIGYMTVTNRNQLSILRNPPESSTIYMFPDTISCGSPNVINYESELIRQWPYLYNKYLEQGQLVGISNNFATIKKWLFMSEMNLIQYFAGSTYKTHMLPHDLKIMRRNSIVEVSNHDIKNEHIISAHYGLGDTWIDVTQTFMELFAIQFDNHENGSRIPIKNSIAPYDPVPLCVKSLVLMTLEGSEYIYREHTVPLIKYQYFYSVECPLKEIKKLVYGTPSKQVDVTKKIMTLLKQKQHVVFVSNHLAETDPAPGDEKILTIFTQSNAQYEFSEYSIVELR